jgi:prevent-host-death family protein
MTATAIGVRELQRDASRLIREVQEEGRTFRITIHGRDTGVVLTYQGRDPQRGATFEEVMTSPLYRFKGQAVIDAQLAELERGRDRSGRISEPR